MNETTASERERFVAWALPILGDSPTWRESGPCELAWQAWQARASLPAPADQTRSQKMRAAGFMPRPTWRSLPEDGDDELEADQATADQPPSQEPQGSSGSLSESSAEARTQVAAPASERLPELLRWCYSKLHYRSFDSMEDALVLDEIKLLLEHGKGAQA